MASGDRTGGALALPSLRTKRSAYGVAVVRSRQGQCDSKPTRIKRDEPRFQKALARPIPTNYQVHFRFLLFPPLLLGAPESEWRPLPKRAAALWEGPARFGRNRESRSREVRFSHPGYGTAGVGILPKQRPSKCAAEKEAVATFKSRRGSERLPIVLRQMTIL